MKSRVVWGEFKVKWLLKLFVAAVGICPNLGTTRAQSDGIVRRRRGRCPTMDGGVELGCGGGGANRDQRRDQALDGTK